MRILVDSCLSGQVATELRRAGHDAAWVGDWPADPGDDEILARAMAQLRVVVTLDKDFGELAVLRRLPHAGIIRLVGFRAAEQASACRLVLERYAADLTAGALLTVEPGRVRIRSGTP